ncbi:hypothetical protein BH24ACT1_BH24ACT1_00600 [soil metagenome]
MGMDQGDPFLPALDPRSPTATEAAATARELVTAYLSSNEDPAILRIVLRSALIEIYEGLEPSRAQTERAAALLCSLVALLQVALSGVGQLATDDEAGQVEVSKVFEQLAASAIDDDLTF